MNYMYNIYRCMKKIDIFIFDQWKLHKRISLENYLTDLDLSLQKIDGILYQWIEMKYEILSLFKSIVQNKPYLNPVHTRQPS